MILSPREAITFTPGLPPLRTTLMRYYENKGLGMRPGWWLRSSKACVHLVAAALLCFVTVTLALMLTFGAEVEASTPNVTPVVDQHQVHVSG